MIISFCGHSEIFDEDNLVNKILDILQTEINGEPVTFYLGGYGDFDYIAKQSCLKYKKLFPSAKLYFVTPYLNDKYLQNFEHYSKGYDGSIYPEIENTPKRYAILERNKWMMKQADIIIAYVNCSFGGAFKSLEYARKINKKYINLETLDLSKQ